MSLAQKMKLTNNRIFEHDTSETVGIDTVNLLSLHEFIREFGGDLMQAVERDNPPVYTPDKLSVVRQSSLTVLKRQPFAAQAEAVQALAALLFDQNEKAAVLNAEMGTGKTMMAICLAHIAQREGYRHNLVISPPHLVYKWRREILDTIPNARVWVLNGPDSLAKLLRLKQLLKDQSDTPEFFILGRVRMRMGFHWRPAFGLRRFRRMVEEDSTNSNSHRMAIESRHPACPNCNAWLRDDDGELFEENAFRLITKQMRCEQCNAALWTLMWPRKSNHSTEALIIRALCQLPTIGPKTAERLVQTFGADMLRCMLADNIHEFLNLMDDEGEFVFNDRQATRLERALAKTEFEFGQGGYQPTEFIKRYLPPNFLDLLIVDEGHEYKNEGSAQGYAMGVLANKAKKVLLLTGTLMGGYATDLFYLLWRIMPARMIELGYQSNERGSMASASMAFMRDHGVLKDIYRVKEDGNHLTSKGKRVSVSTTKGPGFGPLGIAQCVLPFTVFLKLRDIGQKVLPPCDESYEEIEWDVEQQAHYQRLELSLSTEMKRALAIGDKSLLGVIMNTLLAWPDTCFRSESVKHPRTKRTLAFVPALYNDKTPMPKERRLQEICLQEAQAGRKVLVYTTYSGIRDTCSRLKSMLSTSGLKVAVLRSTVATEKREDWLADQVDRGIEVLVCNPELVKTGLDLLEFPTIIFMQSGYNVYTVMQAARRSWRIGQKLAVKVLFLGYAQSAQSRCLQLMSEKIAVSQSTSGDIPDSGLDALNHKGDSIEMALARDLITA